MKGMLKRCSSMLLVLAMVLTMLPISAVAADVPTVTVKTDAITDGTYDKSNNDTLKTTVINKTFTIGDTFYVPVTLSNQDSFDGVGLQFTYNKEVLQFNGAKTAFQRLTVVDDEEMLISFAKTTCNDATKETNVSEAIFLAGNTSAVSNTAPGYLFFAEFEVIGYSEDGTEEIGIKSSSNTATGVVLNAQNIEGLTYVGGEVQVEMDPNGGSNVPEEPAEAPSFEVYYTLSEDLSNVDEDNYYDVKANDTVTAEIYLKNTGTSAQTLQGYDIVVTNDANLTRGNVAYHADVEQKGTEYASNTTSTKLNIQYINNDLQISVAPGAEVQIASIPYTVGASVAVNTEMDITITSAALAVGNNAEGVDADITASVAGVDTLNEFTVTFNSAGGSTAEDQTVIYGGKATEPDPAPTKTGYSFLGWYVGENKWNFNTAITENVDLTAKWSTTSYTLTFVAEGEEVDTVEFNITMDSIQEPAVPAKTGYTGAWGPYDLKKAENQTVNASYTANKYILTFEGLADTIEVTYDANYPALYVGTDKPGYTFVGWFDGDAQIKEGDKVQITKNTALTAKYEPITYTVYFRKNWGNDVIIATKTATYDAVLELPETPERDGYDFIGWNLDEDAQAGMTETELKTLTTRAGDEITLHAIWADAAYEVRFVTNCDTYIAPVNVRFGNAVAEPTTELVKEHYVFAGWYSDRELTSSWNFATVVPNDMVLYAKWEAFQYSVTFKADNETVATKYYTVENTTVEAPAVPTKPGYTGAWESYDFNTIEDKVVNAVYTPITYTLTFKADGVTVGFVNFNVEMTSIQAPTVPTKTGYTGAWGPYDLTKAENQTVEAVYTPITYTLTFKADGVTVGSVNFNVEMTSIQAPTVPTKTGYTGAWGPYDLTKAENQTVEAVYTANTYKVHFQSNGGSDVASKDVVFGTLVTEPTPAPTKAGFVFAGWYSDEELTSPWNFASATMGAADMTLYAKWSIEYVLKDYVYALDSSTQRLLVVNAVGLADGKGYTVNGSNMYYYANGTDYLAGATKGVYLYIVTAADFEEADLGEVTYTNAQTRDDMILDKSTGDVNGNNVIDIGDANAVYQMIRFGGSYYSDSQVGMKGRLIADQHTANNTDENGYATIEDAVAVVTIYNSSKS